MGKRIACTFVVLAATVAVPFNAISAQSCAGDCNNDAEVTVNELLIGVTVALGSASLTACSSFDVDGSSSVEVNEILQAVNNALCGCNLTCSTTGVTPTRSATPAATATITTTPRPSSTPLPTDTPELPSIQLRGRLLSRFQIELTWTATPPSGASVFAVTLCGPDQDRCYPPYHYPLIPEPLSSRRIVVLADAEDPFYTLECFRLDVLDRNDDSLAFSNVVCVQTQG